jgi:hypothetical protein
MPSLRCATCDQRIVADYPEALTIELAGHLERAHGVDVSLEALAPQVRSTMVGGGGVTSLAVARVVAIVIAVFFLLVALDLGPGWLAFSAMSLIMVVVINSVESQQR